MEIPFNEILAIVRRDGKPEAAFEALRRLGEAKEPSPLWRQIEVPDIEADIDAAVAWLNYPLAMSQPTGVYFGLDTLNEDEGEGKTLELGLSNDADPESLEMNWIYGECEPMGEHLIRGIYEIHRTYQDAEYNVSQLADYLFFLGYGGIVLAAALEQLPIDWNAVFVWGFHDGDMGFLARSSQNGIERLAILGE